MGDNSLEELRNIIDSIDKQIVDLLNQRASAALLVGKAKADLDKGVYDPTREKAVLNKIDAINKGPLDKGAIEDIYAAIITACRELQIEQS